MSTDQTNNDIDQLIHQIIDVSVDIYTDGKHLANFPPSSITSDFAVGLVPSCIVVLNDNNISDYTEVTDDIFLDHLLNLYTTSELSIDIRITFRDIDIKSNTINRTDVPITIFSGIVNSVVVSRDAKGSGGSSNGLVISAVHRFATLFKYEAGGMLYTTSSKIKIGNSLYELIESMTNKDNKPATAYSDPIVQRVLASTVPVVDAASGKNCSPIPVIIDKLIHEMYTDKIIQYDETLPKREPCINILEYIEGTLYPKSFNKTTRGYLEVLLRSFIAATVRNTIGDAVLSSINNSTMLTTIAPRSVDKITIIPADGTLENTSKPLVITTDMYKSIKCVYPDDVYPDPDGVVLTYSGSNVYKGDGAGTIVLCKYPDMTESGRKFRWKTIAAPKWISAIDTITSSVGDSGTGTPTISNAEIKEVGVSYAEAVFNNLKYSKNTCNITMGVRGIEAFAALGSLCHIKSYKYGDIDGVLSRYVFRYAQSASSGDMSVNLTFTKVRPHRDKDDKSVLYDIDRQAEPTKFPDLLTKFDEYKPEYEVE